MDLDGLRGRRVGLLASGGLSSTAVAAWLAENGVDVVAYVADLGQTVPLPAAELAAELERRGLKAQTVDLRAEMAEMGLDLVRYRAMYEGGYWNTTGASRAVLVGGLAEALRTDGCQVLAHGCVGGGNDQMRFFRYTARLAPDLEVFTPWTQPELLRRFPNRTSMSEYLIERDYPESLTNWATYSVDGSLAGFSHESDELESLETPPMVVSPILTACPQDAQSDPEILTVRFVDGRPVEVDGAPVTPLEAVQRANEAGGRHGVSLKAVVENRVNGTKCRGVYEAPGLEVLGVCMEALYQAGLDKYGAALMRSLSANLGTAIYEGGFHCPSGRAAAAGADVLTRGLDGTVEVELYKGNVTVRRMLDLADAPGTVRQTRFTHGGHHWQIEPGRRLTA